MRLRTLSGKVPPGDHAPGGDSVVPAATFRTMAAFSECMCKTRVLIVDDDLNLSRLSGMILENSGKYEVLIVNQATRALAAAVQFQPALMLLDIDMPEKSGGDIAREAATDSRLREIPVLFLTGLVSKSEAGTAQLESGGMTFLAKPVEPSLLLSCVAELTGRKLAA